MHGKGTFTWKDGRVYVGDYHYGKKNGFGTFLDPNKRTKYEGNWTEGAQSGRGKLTIEGFKSRYGEWENGELKQWSEPIMMNQQN